MDGALAAFQWFYNVRNQSIAHRYGPHRMADTMVFVDEDTGELLGDGVGVSTMYQPSTDTDVLGHLIQIAIRYAESQAAALKVKCKAEMEAMYPSERRRLDVASYRVPDERSLRLGRRKYKNINRQRWSGADLPTQHEPKEISATIVKLNSAAQDGSPIQAGVEVLGILEEDETWCAIALAFDLQGYGPDLESACTDLTRAIEAQFNFAINDERGDLDQVFFATERQYFERFNDFRHVATVAQLRKLAEELQRLAERSRPESGARPALRLQAIEESNPTTDIATDITNRISPKDD